MATRYCGRVRLTMTWHNNVRGEYYKVNVSCPLTHNLQTYCIEYDPTRHGHAVDSSHAWNYVAAEVVRTLAYDEVFGEYLGFNHAVNIEQPLPLRIATISRVVYEVLP